MCWRLTQCPCCRFVGMNNQQLDNMLLFPFSTFEAESVLRCGVYVLHKNVCQKSMQAGTGRKFLAR